jgi:hypothetical protein
MKNSMLKSLNGLSLAAAEKIVKDNKLKVMSLPHGTVISLISKPDTVILYYKDSKVTSAFAGDMFDVTPD